jgi:hypothetical protein
MSAPPSAAAFDALTRAAEASAWRRGALAWLMLPTQRAALRAFNALADNLILVILCSRRWGKTRFAVLKVWMVAITTPGAIIRYAAPTKDHGRKFVHPAFAWVSRLAPEHLRPKWSHQNNSWTWPNGAVCHLGSCETEADVDAQVGTECHFAVVDEAGKIRARLLRKLIRSILGPQVLTVVGARMCVLGTPPDTPEHFFRELVTEALARGTLVKHTIDDCKHVDQRQLELLLKELGGRTSTEARRELDCEFVTEKRRAIVPDFPEHREAVVRVVERPKYFDTYVSADMGYRDLSIALFAYYHFDLDLLVIEDELVRQHTGNVPVARAIRKREHELWGAWRQPLERIADTDPQARADMYDGTKLDEDGNPCEPIAFGFPKKHDRDAGINAVITKIRDERIVINPRCTTLIAHIEFGIWNENRTDFERVDGHHWDGIPAASYLLRAVDWGRDPRPRFEPSGVPFHETGISPANAAAYAEQMRVTNAGPQQAMTLLDHLRSPRKR